jgi:hypothetical protein
MVSIRVFSIQDNVRWHIESFLVVGGRSRLEWSARYVVRKFASVYLIELGNQ